MNLTEIIAGEVSTEKALRQKGANVHTLVVHPQATKVQVKQALRRYYGVEPTDVRIVNVRQKNRVVGRGRNIRKRDAVKRALVTLSSKSKVLDLSQFQTS